MRCPCLLWCRGELGVEERGDAALIFLRALAEYVRVLQLGQVPMIDRAAGGVLVENVEVVLGGASGGDQEQWRLHGGDAVLEHARPRLAGERVDRLEHDPAGRG